MNTQTKSTVFLLLGGNLGNVFQTFIQAKKYLQDAHVVILEESSIYQTAAWGVENQPDFLNQVLKITTFLDANRLLQLIHQIEKQLGRERYQKWYARTIDIDILYFEDQIVETVSLQIPHPFLHQRRFTLVPLVELAADFMHPVLQQNNRTLLDICEDKLEVNVFVAPLT